MTATVISDFSVICPICKGLGTVEIGTQAYETGRRHTCLRCYGSRINKLHAQEHDQNLPED